MATSSSISEKQRRGQRFSDVSAEMHLVLQPIDGYKDYPLVSLEEAVKELVKYVPRVVDMVKRVKANISTRADNLPVDGRAAIMLYTIDNEPLEESFFYVLNYTLRAEQRTALKPWFPYLKLVLTTLEYLPSNARTVYRGVKTDLSMNHKKGKQFTWWGFSSCTTSESVLKLEQFMGTTGQRTEFIIECLTGKIISQYSMYPNENEVLILPGTKFEVIDVSRSSDLCIIKLKEIPSLIDNHHAKLIKRIENSKLGGEVELNNWQIGNGNMQIVIDNALNRKRCTILHLSYNRGISFSGASLLASTLEKNNTLLNLYLSNNPKFDSSCVQVLAEALKSNRTLKVLHLSNNPIEDTGAEYLANMLESNKTLIELRLDNGDIHNRGIVKLAKALTTENTTLQSLDVRYNQFGDACSASIIEMLQKNETLIHFLVLDNTFITASTRARLQEVGKERLNS